MAQTDEQHQACAACFKGHRLDGEPKGTMEELGGLAYYYAPGKSGQQADKAIVLGTDMFGLGIPNCKLIADWFASNTGLPVFVPDLLEGDYVDPDSLGLEEAEEPMAAKPFLTRVRITLSTIWAFLYKIGPRFLSRHSMGHVEPIADKFCRDLKEQKGFKRLGWVGYCFGGTLAVLLAKEGSPIDVSVCFHPGGPSASNWSSIAKPFMLVCSEEDFSFDRIKPTVLPMLAQLWVPVEIHDDNKGTTHGFGCRPNLGKPEIRVTYERGLERTKGWFEKHL
ncbi:hypothetical protein JCM10908_001127 [Rhodotorula pacifica]|uniref:dienelactone hydrolase family protein n=1 Tax=Rhodotorula pacifica TaxID=1495444 RepID=UPI00317DBEF1